jgi:probable rRNA maturation factor
VAVSVVSPGRWAGIRRAVVRHDARRVLRALDETAADVTISLVDDAAIHRLNRTYRGKDTPTDVLAFAMREGPRVAGDAAELGDVVISIDTARRQAARRRCPPAAEVRTLLIHGLLHLLGYDHERSGADARRMRRLERRLAALLAAADRHPAPPRGRARPQPGC